jgi:hypothetical protein
MELCPGYRRPIAAILFHSCRFIRPATIWAGHNGELGVYRTTDARITWAQVNDGLTDLFVFALAIQSEAPFTVYAGTGSGVFRFEK